MKIKDVIATLEEFAPLPLQESYDNAGLQVGVTGAEVSGVLLCLDVTEAVLEEAVRRGCNMVVSHHPLLFGGLKRVGDVTMVERCVRMAVRCDVTVYSAHTNLDNARGGVNFRIAERLGLRDVRFLQPTAGGTGGSGVMGELPEALEAAAFLRQVKQLFGVEALQHNVLLERPVRTVALCGGAGDFLLDKALEVGADAFLTGEMHYHHYFGHEGAIQIGVLGHYQSEQFTIDLLADVLNRACGGLRIVKTEINTNPIHYLYV